MFTIVAPYPALQTTSLLPNPSLSDEDGLKAEVTTKRTHDGTLYTYVKSKQGRRRFLWTFLLTRAKALELRAFYNSYFASEWKVTDHNGLVWRGYVMNNPFEFDTPRRAGPARGDFAAESQTITIEFEGVSSA